MATGLELIEAERQRQTEVEGWTAEHDDRHGPAVLLDAALCYQAGTVDPDPRTYRNGYGRYTPLWPWSLSWWKPKDRLRDLVRAGALAQAAADVALRRRDAIAAEVDGLLSQDGAA